MPDINSVKAALNQGYDQFINQGIPGVVNQVNANQGAEQGWLQNTANTGAASIGNQRQAVLGALGNARTAANQNASKATNNINQSIQHSQSAFGRNPLTIGDPGADQVDNTPALQQLQNQIGGQFANQANSFGRIIGNQERDTNLTYNNDLNALEGWRKQHEQAALSHYANQRMALSREKYGADLERHLMLANALALQANLKNIGSVYNTLSNQGVY